jgi:hypothetical protein
MFPVVRGTHSDFLPGSAVRPAVINLIDRLRMRTKFRVSDERIYGGVSNGNRRSRV